MARVLAQLSQSPTSGSISLCLLSDSSVIRFSLFFFESSIIYIYIYIYIYVCVCVCVCVCVLTLIGYDIIFLLKNYLDGLDC